MATARWTLGFVLRMNSVQFDSAMRKAAQQVRELDARSKQSLLSRHQYERSIIATQRAAMTQHAIQAAALFTTLGTLNRAYRGLTDTAANYQYEAKSLSLLLKAQGNAGDGLYRQFEKLNPTIREFASTEVVGMMKRLAQAGYNHNEILKGTGSILNAVRASMGELSTTAAVELGINLDRAFGTATLGMTQLLDTATAAANQFPMTMGQITKAMGYATEAAVEFKQPIDEVMVSLGLLMPIVKTAEKAGTAYRNMMQSLAKEGTIEFLERFGVQAKDNNGEMRRGLDIYLDIFSVLEKIEDKTKSQMMREALMRKLGGTRGAAGFALMDRLLATTTGAAGTPFEGMKFATREAALMGTRMGIAGIGNETKNLAEELREASKILEQRFNVSLTNAAIAIGTKLLPIQDRFHRAFSNILDWISEALGGGKYNPEAAGSATTDFGAAFIGSLTAGAGAAGLVYGLSALKGAGSFMRNPQGWMQAALGGAVPIAAAGTAPATRGGHSGRGAGFSFEVNPAGGTTARPGLYRGPYMNLLTGATSPGLGRLRSGLASTAGSMLPSGLPSYAGIGQSRGLGAMLTKGANAAGAALQGLAGWGKNFLNVGPSVTDWLGRLAGVAGLAVGAWAMAVDSIKNAARKLFDYGDIASREQAARFANLTDAEIAMRKLITEGLSAEEETRAARMGYGPVLNTMQAYFEEGLDYEQAWNKILDNMGRGIDIKFADLPEERAKEREKLAVYKESMGRAVKEFSLMSADPARVKMGLVTKEHLLAQQKALQLNPALSDPWYRGGRRAGSYTLGYRGKLEEEHLVAKQAMGNLQASFWSKLMRGEKFQPYELADIENAQKHLEDARSNLFTGLMFADAASIAWGGGGAQTLGELYAPGAIPAMYKAPAYSQTVPGFDALMGNPALIENASQRATAEALKAGANDLKPAAKDLGVAAGLLIDVLNQFKRTGLDIDPSAGGN